jgi:8-hydroxy-5-deazaflavin:NADPH oxidoreductase
MRIGILGTGMVGQTIGARLIELKHDVRLGSRSSTNDKARAWAEQHGPRASHGTFADAAGFGQMVVNCTPGAASIDALTAAGQDMLRGKVIVDVANPLDTSQNRRGPLLFCNTESLGERIQATFPDARVVKTLNTMWCGLMVNPRLIGESHTVYMSGNDASAKSDVAEILASFGWRREEMVDLGDISGARGTEMLLPLWLRLWQATGTGAFNFTIVRARENGEKLGA